MATHDYDIANQSGAAFRTDLNNALAAIQSNNSNSSSPATTVAYQWWADTTSGTLKIRNSSNNDWVELFQLDGTLTLEDGAVGTPALAFRDDLNTGIFSSAADTFDIATAGVARLQLDASETTFNEDGADTDFRIEGDTDTRLFFLDAGTDRIGIGVDSAPLSKLHVQDVEGTTLTLGNTAAAASDGDYLSGIDFHIKDNNDTTGATCASIRTFADQNHTASAKGTALALFTVDDDTTVLDERLRITHDGKVGIGTSSPNTNLHVLGSNSGGELEAIRLHNNNTASGTKTSIGFTNTTQADYEHAKITATRDNSGRLDFFVGAQSHAVLCVDGFASGVVGVNTIQASKALDVNGEIRTNSGLLFGSDTAASNKLDDYEEGTFTVTLPNGGGTVTFSAMGKYHKIGGVVHVQVAISNIQNHAVVDILIGGLPFTSSSLSTSVSNVLTNRPALTNGLCCFINDNEAQIRIRSAFDSDGQKGSIFNGYGLDFNMTYTVN